MCAWVRERESDKEKTNKSKRSGVAIGEGSEEMMKNNERIGVVIVKKKSGVFIGEITKLKRAAVSSIWGRNQLWFYETASPFHSMQRNRWPSRVSPRVGGDHKYLGVLHLENFKTGASLVFFFFLSQNWVTPLVFFSLSLSLSLSLITWFSQVFINVLFKVFSN